MFLITVKLSEIQNLNFTVIEYESKEGHIKFTDSKTGMLKSFPQHMCYIEEVER